VLAVNDNGAQRAGRSWGIRMGRSAQPTPLRRCGRLTVWFTEAATTSFIERMTPNHGTLLGSQYALKHGSSGPRDLRPSWIKSAWVGL